MIILSNFGERLSEVMFDKNITAKELSEQTNIGYNSLTRYLQGIRLPTFNVFAKLVTYFNCSADFILGLNEQPKYEETYQEIKPFSECLKNTLTHTKVSQYALQKQTGISWANFHYWLTGKREPYIDSIIKIANALDVSIDYLLGRVK